MEVLSVNATMDSRGESVAELREAQRMRIAELEEEVSRLKAELARVVNS